MEWSIRDAVTGDAAQILAIYAPYVTDTCVSFETEVPSVEEFTRRISEILKSYAYLVCEARGEIVGYAYAGSHRSRPAYRFSAEPSVYIKREYHRQGIGRALYQRLIARLRERGYYTLCAGVALPNEGSVGLHHAMGFRDIGVYHNIGYKLGEWRDTLWMEMPLRDYGAPPAETR